MIHPVEPWKVGTMTCSPILRGVRMTGPTWSHLPERRASGPLHVTGTEPPTIHACMCGVCQSCLVIGHGRNLPKVSDCLARISPMSVAVLVGQ